MRRLAALLLALAALAGCAPAVRPFALAAPRWHDPDRRPFAPKPEELVIAETWDAIDHSIFRPISRFWAVDPGGEATNVNAVDEVPDSSWFTRRLGWQPLSADDVRRGACRDKHVDGDGPWTVVGGKPGGANPGFLVEDARGQKLLIKVDGTTQGPRMTAADVIVSRLYHAAGYRVPCYQLVYFERSALTIAPGATRQQPTGEKVPFTEADLESILAKALKLEDGRYRGGASLFLEGEALGPWLYEGVRGDDRNDVVPHEDRRELRASRLLAAWTDHSDQRAQNTLSTWIEVGPGLGYVEHALIDFGDCMGFLWSTSAIQARRRGHTYWFDPKDIATDLLTLGMLERPWDRAQLGEGGTVLGFFDVERFDPPAWKPAYPNPAFVRMTDRDAAWMARIVAQLDDRMLEAIVAEGELGPALSPVLFHILRRRRNKVLDAYLARVSPLTRPRVVAGRERAELCLDDLAAPRYGGAPLGARARAWHTLELRRTAKPKTRRRGRGRVCTELSPVAGATKSEPGYLIVDVFTRFAGHEPPPARVHLYHLGDRDFRVVGLERPYDSSPL